MDILYQKNKTNTHIFNTKKLHHLSEKKSVMNPNNNSPNIFTQNLKMRLMNYQLVSDLEKNPLNLYM